MRVIAGPQADPEGTPRPRRRTELVLADLVDGVAVERVETPATPGSWKASVDYFRALADGCRRPGLRPDVITFLSLPLAAIPALIRLRSMGIPLVFTQTMMRQVSSGGWKRRVQDMEWRARLQLMDCVVVSSSVMREELRALGITTRVEVIPNGLELSRFRPVGSDVEKLELRRKLQLPMDAELILFVGSISPRKGVDLLVEAWQRISRSRPRAYLVLVGPTHAEIRPGSPEAAFEAAIEEGIASSSAPDRVIRTGAVDGVEDYLRAADVFVFPSRWEGMPNVVIEAFGCGVPCVITPFVGLPDEFGQPDTHYLLVDRSSREMAAAISDLLNHPERRRHLSESALARVTEQFDVEESLNRYAALYRELGSRQAGYPAKLRILPAAVPPAAKVR